MISVADEGALRSLTLQRPEKANARTAKMLEALAGDLRSVLRA